MILAHNILFFSVIHSTTTIHASIPMYTQSTCYTAHSFPLCWLLTVFANFRCCCRRFDAFRLCRGTDLQEHHHPRLPPDRHLDIKITMLAIVITLAQVDGGCEHGGPPSRAPASDGCVSVVSTLSLPHS